MDQKSAQLIREVASSPARAIDRTLDVSKQLAQTVTRQSGIKKAREYWHILGPGLTTGAADDDPSGIATYSQQGAQFGYQLLWLAPFTFPLMAMVQEMCARIGLVTGRGLAANIRRHYSEKLLYLATLLLLVANIFNLGADLGAMAKAAQLLLPGLNFFYLVTFFTLISLTLQIFTGYKEYARYLKYLALILLSYVLSAVIIPGLDWPGILRTSLTPSFRLSSQSLILITGILGTTISPYLFFWQTSQEVEEEILRGKTTLQSRQQAITRREMGDMRLDVWTGMFISNLVMFFIIVACAATLHSNGVLDINTASDAALALRPLAGDHAYLLFTLGIVGSGLLAVPILAGSASYAISEALGWKLGLYRKLREASAFYGVIIIAMLVGFALNFVGLHPIKILVYSAVANGLIAPVILFFIVSLSSSHKIMGNWANNPVSNLVGWFTVGLMSLSAVVTVVSLFSGWFAH